MEVHDGLMDSYIIGSGAILHSGAKAGAAAASLHAKVDPFLARRAKAIAIDFEGGRQADLDRVLLLVVGWNTARFAHAVLEPLATGGQATLSQALAACAVGSGQHELQLFARWLPDQTLRDEVRRFGVELVVHPLEAIESAALVSGQRFRSFTGYGATMQRNNGTYERFASGGRR